MVRRQAIWAMPRHKDPRAVAALIGVIGNEQESETNRRVAVTHLSYLRHYIFEKDFVRRDAEKDLLNLLKSSNPDVRKCTCSVLGNILSQKAVLPLTGLIEDEDLYVRIAAIMALESMALSVHLPDDPVADALMRALEDPNKSVRTSAISVLGKMKAEKALEPMLAALVDDTLNKYKVIEALGYLRDPRATLPLLKCLKNCSAGYAKSVVRTLGKIGDKRAVPALISILKHGRLLEAKGVSLVRAAYARSPASPSIQVLAAEALGRIGDPRAIEPLIGALDDNDRRLQSAAIEALGSIIDVKAILALLSALKTIDGSMERYIFISLDRVSIACVEKRMIDMHTLIGIEKAVTALNPKHREFGEQYVAILRKSLSRQRIRDEKDSKTMDLLDELSSSHIGIRLNAMETLSKGRKKRALPLIIEALYDDNPEVRRTAATALGYYRDKTLSQPLINKLKDDDVAVRINAIRSLGRIRSRQAVLPLIESLHDPDLEVRGAAASALGQIKDDRATKPLLEFLRKNENAPKRKNAIWAIKIIEDQSAVPPLCKSLKNLDNASRLYAVKVLGEFRDLRAVDPLIDLLENEGNPQIVSAAARALAKIGDKRAIEPLKVTMANADRSSPWSENPFKASRAALQQLTGEVLATSDVSSYIYTQPQTDALMNRSIAKLENGTLEHKKNAIAKLASHKDRRAVAPLIASLKDGNSGVRLQATKGLIKLRDSQALLPLAALLEDPNATVRRQASWGIEYLLSWSRPRPGLQDKQRLKPSLVKALADHDEAVRKHAALALAKLNDKRAVEVLISMLQDPNPSTRANTAYGLGEIRDPRAFTPLTQTLNDEFKHFVGHALGALSKIDGPRAVPYLIKALEDEDAGVRNNAIICLGKVGDKRAIAPLMGILEKDPNRKTKDFASKAINDIMISDRIN